MFNMNDFSVAKHTMADFREWAGEVAGSYLQQGITPNTTIEKIAKLEELTPYDVQTLCTESNKLIHNTKYASANEKYHAANFPLADSAEIIRNLQNHEVVKTASFVAPEKVDNGPDVWDMFGVKPEEMDKTASVKHQLKVASDKATLLLQKLADDQNNKATEFKIAEQAFIKEARQLALQADSSLERMQTLGVIEHFVKCAGAENGRHQLAKVAYILGREGKLEPGHAKKAQDYFMSKEADCKAPAELISENLDVQVVNGDHPLYITIKTVDNAASAYARACNQYSLVDDKLKILGQKIRAL